jgi:hypothetical protein
MSWFFFNRSPKEYEVGPGTPARVELTGTRAGVANHGALRHMSREARNDGDQPLNATENEILEILREVIVERGLTLREFAGLPANGTRLPRSQREHFKSLSRRFLAELLAGEIKPQRNPRRKRG